MGQQRYSIEFKDKAVKQVAAIGRTQSLHEPIFFNRVVLVPHAIKETVHGGVERCRTAARVAEVARIQAANDLSAAYQGDKIVWHTASIEIG